MPMTKMGSDDKKSDELKAILSKGLSEALRVENLAGTWPIEKLEEMESEFNLLPAGNEEQRFLLLNRFFHAKAIFHIIIDEYKLPSKDAHRIDLSDEKFDAMRRNVLPATKDLSQFSKACYGPADKEENEPLHNEHVKTFLHSKIPLPYQRMYQDEPALLASLKRCGDNQDKFEISIEHLVPVKGFCRCCIGHKHRQTLQAIPFSKITSILIHYNKNGSSDLIIETA